MKLYYPTPTRMRFATKKINFLNILLKKTQHMLAWVFSIFIASQYFASGNIFSALEDYTGKERETFFYIHLS